MKKILLLLSFIFFLSITVYSQTNTEHLKYSTLYLTVGGKQVKFSSINDNTMVKLLGHPIKISKKPWETMPSNKVKTFYYKGLEISTVMGSLEFIDITEPSISFTFLINNKFSKPFFVGSPADMVKRYFPKAFATKDKNGVFIAITHPGGTGEEDTIRFTFSGNTIKTIEYAVNES